MKGLNAALQGFCRLTFMSLISLVIAAPIQAKEIEEIVVTALKRAESITDIGVTVTAFSGDAIKELGFSKPKDIGAHTPGLETYDTGSSGIPVFAIRGVGLDDFNANNTSGVAVYFDEVNASSALYLNGQMFDLERVEVLKGPQGTLYGRNATGGAINYVAKQPTEEFGGYITGKYSRWDTKEVEAVVNGALTDRINSRLSFYTAHGDGWKEDIITGEEFADKDIFAGRWLTSFDITDNVNLLINLNASRDHSKPSSPQNIGTDDFFLFLTPPGTLGVPSTSDATDVAVGDFDLVREEDGFGVSGKLTIDFEHFTLTSITAYNEYDRLFTENTDGNRLNELHVTYDDETDTFSQELRLSSNPDGAFTWGGRVSWIAGLTYSDYEYFGDNFNDTSVFQQVLSLLLNLQTGGFFPVLPPGTSVRTGGVVTQSTESFGVFLHTETDITDRLSLIAGVRYSKDEHDFNVIGTAIDGNIPLFSVPGQQLFDLDRSNSDDNVSGKIGLDFQLSDDWLLYGSFSTGYKAGVYYGLVAIVEETFDYVEPETVEAWEVGFKGTLLDNSMQLNFSAFLYDYQDRQSQAVGNLPTQEVVVTLVNVPESEMKGVELEWRWLPIDGLDLRAGVGYLDAEVTDNSLVIPGGGTIRNPVPNGVELPSSPDWSFSLIGSYTWNIGNYEVIAQADYSWSDVRSIALGDVKSVVPSRESIGARMSVGPANGKWQLAGWGRNLGDSQPVVNGFTGLLGGETVYRQQPRSYGVELTYNF